MNSTTALVTTDHQQWVAKWAAGAGSAVFQHGARIADRLADAGMQPQWATRIPYCHWK